MKKLNNILIIVIAIIVIGGVFAYYFWQKNKEKKTSPSQNKVWVSINPVQCKGNPWEKNFPQENNDEDTIKKYYQSLKFTIYDIKITPSSPGTIVCMACSCPRGDTIKVMVSQADADKLISQGFKKVSK